MLVGPATSTVEVECRSGVGHGDTRRIHRVVHLPESAVQQQRVNGPPLDPGPAVARGVEVFKGGWSLRGRATLGCTFCSERRRPRESGPTSGSRPYLESSVRRKLAEVRIASRVSTKSARRSELRAPVPNVQDGVARNRSARRSVWSSRFRAVRTESRQRPMLLAGQSPVT